MMIAQQARGEARLAIARLLQASMLVGEARPLLKDVPEAWGHQLAALEKELASWAHTIDQYQQS